MKNKILVMGAVAMALAICSPVHAQTERLGAEYGYDFNKTRSVTKTTDYTITASDSEVKATASSADITLTLPSVSDCQSGGRCQFKILKTDGTTYDIIVTPATGDTIGGESSRGLINQNDYMVIHAGPGKDWTVDFESPYVGEDHEARTTNLGTQSYDASIVFEGATADAYETTLAVTDPTADVTWQMPTGGASTAYFMGSTLATNFPDIANSVTGASNALVFEGATADAYEAKISSADQTADTIFTLPALAAATYGIVPSTLATNGPDIVNSVYGGTNGFIFEGATADAYETTIAPTDPTADRTLTMPDATGTVALRTGETTTETDTLTAGECGKVIFLNSATEYVTTLPALSTVPSGCQFEFVVKAAASAANYTVVTGNSLENKIYGSMEVAGAVVACADEDTITLVDGNAIGDNVKVISDGANWYVSGSTVTTAKATCTQVD